MMLLNDFHGEERIFLDANIFLFHALDHEKFGEDSTVFLRKLEEGKIRGVITPLVIDEILFKILVGSATKILGGECSIADIKRRLKEKRFAIASYKAVDEYTDYLWGLSQQGLEILELDAGIALESTKLGADYSLLTTDAFHIASMKRHSVSHLATNDPDFERVEFITVWKPKEIRRRSF